MLVEPVIVQEGDLSRGTFTAVSIFLYDLVFSRMAKERPAPGWTIATLEYMVPRSIPNS